MPVRKPLLARGRERGTGPHLRIAAAAALALGLTAASVVLGTGADSARPAPSAPALAAGVPVERLPADDLARGTAALQRHLDAQPKDAAGWATLGVAYVEQARTSGDPTRYPKAEKAFARSLELRPAAENDAALAGQAVLAAARHDFASALDLADRALRVNEYSERALAGRVDALVELGRYDEAYRAVRLADRRRPGIPVFTRYAYVLELRGDTEGAGRVLTRALRSATAAADRAYVATALGQLDFSRGRYRQALDHFAVALRADPQHVPAQEGLGRTHAAQGEERKALKALEEAARRQPLPGRVAALGELHEAAGNRTEAARQYELAGTWMRLADANGVAGDLESALVAADHGDPAEALASARAEWKRRETVHTADALGWALHVNGRHREALVYARKATAPSPGYRDASFLYHLGMIERALGDGTQAARHLRAALDLNPGFSPVGARRAEAALKTLPDPAGPSGRSAS
ncbi:tetratricopeptide repeat protein [Streptomyces sp. NPDC048389]|uniref:tetratricopeptide repeat protein n=1 Tax=Streptomyces sp. NPDC048389 TaxID=3154622 RepID=UPI0034549552